jgi:cell division protein FtsB
MSVRVNLLPQEVHTARAGRRATNVTILLVLLFVALLGGLYVLKLQEIQQAEEERDAVQAEVDRLEAEVASLEQFRQLADELEARNAILASAMAREVSYARLLNDMSLAFPANASLRTLQVTAQDPADAPGGVSFGDSVAIIAYNGYSVERYAPGVETVIIEFDKVDHLFATYLTAAQTEEVGDTEVTGFSGTVQVDDDAYTQRYADGLPEEVAP